RGAGDGACVLALGRDVGEAVEQILARHADGVEPEAAVVDAVEAELLAAVLDAHAGPVATLLVAAGDEDGVDAVGLAGDDELSEDDGQAAVTSGVADVFLVSVVVGREYDELVGGGVVGGCGFDVRDVRAVT